MTSSLTKNALVAVFIALLSACGGGDGDGGLPADSASASQTENSGLATTSENSPNPASASSSSPVVAKQASMEILALEGAIKGYPLTTVIWQSRQIPTCWQVDGATFNKYKNEMNAVRTAISETWEKYSEVRFTGWQRCPGTVNDGISIAIQDTVDGVHVKRLGSALNRVSEGMVLNFEYVNWSPSCQTEKSFCNAASAIHEFGHALGFAHEQNRPDTPETCKKEPQGTDGNVPFGGWDEKSVMNYCNPHWNGDGKLSPTDIQMVESFYGSSSILDILSGVF